MKSHDVNSEAYIKIAITAHDAPFMLIDSNDSNAGEAYRRMESAVLHNPLFYTTVTTFSFSAEVVAFYAKLERGDFNIPEMAI